MSQQMKLSLNYYGQQSTTSRDTCVVYNKFIVLFNIYKMNPTRSPTASPTASPTYFPCSANVIIPNGTVIIPDNAFKGCTNLVSIYLPTSVLSLGSATFYGCTSLQYISLPDSIESLGQSVFQSAGLKSIVLTSKINIVPYAAFRACTSLKTVTLTNSITTISDFSFKGCTALTTINFISGLKTIGNHIIINNY